MIDIHMHVVPGVDDGCCDLEESLKMVRKAVNQGIDIIIATPHSFAFDDFGDEVRRRFDSLREELQENSIPVRISSGVRYTAAEPIWTRTCPVWPQGSIQL